MSTLQCAVSTAQSTQNILYINDVESARFIWMTCRVDFIQDQIKLQRRVKAHSTVLLSFFCQCDRGEAGELGHLSKFNFDEPLHEKHKSYAILYHSLR